MDLSEKRKTLTEELAQAQQQATVWTQKAVECKAKLDLLAELEIPAAVVAKPKRVSNGAATAVD